MTWKHDNLTYTAGVNWQLSDNHSLGVRADLTHQMKGKNQVIYDEDVFENDALIDHLYSHQTSKETKPLGWLTNTYYNGKVGKLGIDFNFDLMRNGTDAGKLVLSYPAWKGELEAGTEMTFVNRNNTYWIDKAIIANSDAEHRSMDEWFPTASYSVTLGKVQTALSYSMKTYRPSFFAMNDAVTYISRYMYQAGNSQLLNERVRDLTLNVSYKWITLTASYEHLTNPITQWNFLTETDAMLCKHINLDKPINTMSAYLAVTPRAGIWSLNATAGIEKQDLYLDVEGPQGVYLTTSVSVSWHRRAC